MNRSTFYKCIHHAPSNREIENKKLDADILAIYYDTNCRYGAPKKKYSVQNYFLRVCHKCLIIPELRPLRYLLYVDL